MRLIELRATDVADLSRVRTSGFVRHFNLAGRSHDEPRKWILDDVASTIKGVSSTTPLAVEITANERQTSFGAWAPTWDRLDTWIQQWQLFNPHLLEYRPAHALPALKPGTLVRLCAIGPFRATKYPIETRFGINKEEGQQSPVVQLLNSMPQASEGSTTFIQILWRRHLTPFSLSIFPHWELMARGKDLEALQSKQRERYTYDVQIRIVETHEDAAVARRVNYCKAAADAFRFWDRPNSNRLVAHNFPFVSHPGAVRLLTAVLARRFAWGWGRHLNKKPNYTKDELAALAHPPPPGAKVPRMPKQQVSADVAPHSMIELNQQVLRDHAAWRRQQTGPPSASGAAALGPAEVRKALQRDRLYRPGA